MTPIADGSRYKKYLQQIRPPLREFEESLIDTVAGILPGEGKIVKKNFRPSRKAQEAFQDTFVKIAEGRPYLIKDDRQ